MRQLFYLLLILLIFTQFSFTQKRPKPPVRLYTDPGAPKFIDIQKAKFSSKDLLKLNGNFVVGPEYNTAAENNKQAGVPEGTVQQFSIDSKDGTIYNPGIAREVFGTVDPNNPKTLFRSR